MRIPKWSVFFVLLLASCTTVELDETVLFQGKRSVVPSDFPKFGYEHEALELQTTVMLDGWYLDNPSAETLVIYFGGQGFHLVQSSPQIQFLADRNVDVLAFDYRGYGRSGGEPSVDALKADALMIHELALDRYAPEKIVVHGHSMGTFIATYLANERELEGVVLQNPSSDAEGWRAATIPWLLRAFIDFEIPESIARESNVTRMAEIKVPTLVAAGTEDKITPPELARAVYDASAAEARWLEVIEGAGHNDLEARDEFGRAYDVLLNSL